MINLLPPKERLAREVAKQNSILRRYIELFLLMAFILAALLVGSYFFLMQQATNTKKEVALAAADAKKLEVVQSEAEALSRSIKTIAALLEGDRNFSQMLTDIGAVTPDGTVLTGIEINEETVDAPLIISAQVENERRAAILRNNLQKSPLFESAEIKSITRREEKEIQDRYSFVAVIETVLAEKSEAKP